MKKLKQLTLMMLILFSISCSKDDDNPTPTPSGGDDDDPITLTQTSPINGATEVTIDTILQWEGNADEYDIYFDTKYPPEVIVNTSTVTETEFELSGLQYSTKYYWKVVAKTASDTIESAMWSFTTGKKDISTWEKFYGGSSDEPENMIQLNDGGLIVMSREDYKEPYVKRLDEDGNIIWENYYSNLEDPNGNSVGCNTLLKNPEGGFFILHKLASFSYSLEKFSSDGINIGSVSIETTNGSINSIVPTEDGGFALAGTTPELSYYTDLWFAKTDNTGTIIWSQTIGETYYDEVAYAIIETQDGGFAITGKSDAPALYSTYDKDNVRLFKVDKDGNALWDRTYGGTENDEGKILVEKTNGDLVLGCNTESKGAEGSDIWIIVIDLEGKTERMTFGGTGYEHIGGIVLTETGNIVVSSDIDPKIQLYRRDVWLFELDNSLDKVWEMTYGGTSTDVERALVGTQDGGYAIAVLAYSNTEQTICVIKTDEEGVVREN